MKCLRADTPAGRDQDLLWRPAELIIPFIGAISLPHLICNWRQVHRDAHLKHAAIKYALDQKCIHGKCKQQSIFVACNRKHQKKAIFASWKLMSSWQWCLPHSSALEEFTCLLVCIANKVNRGEAPFSVYCNPKSGLISKFLDLIIYTLNHWTLSACYRT